MVHFQITTISLELKFFAYQSTEQIKSNVILRIILRLSVSKLACDLPKLLKIMELLILTV